MKRSRIDDLRDLTLGTLDDTAQIEPAVPAINRVWIIDLPANLPLFLSSLPKI
jgi:hypothetical protein